MSSPQKLLWKSLDAVMALLLVLMIAMVFTNVVLRYGFDSGLRESIELSRMGMVWLVMLGAVVVLRRDEHLALTELSERAFPRFVPILKRLVFVVIFVSALMLFWGSFRQMNANWNNISQVTGLPSGLFYLAGVISAMLMGAIALLRIFKSDALRDPEQLPRQEIGHS
ncbi:MAG: TRAP transporter small permease [Hydrogenophaga sp.]|jgi:TRAP-type transport system small permease protein|nr:TRAP transporter small permease [Hydrogenophaga sp.]